MTSWPFRAQLELMEGEHPKTLEGRELPLHDPEGNPYILPFQIKGSFVYDAAGTMVLDREDPHPTIFDTEELKDFAPEEEDDVNSPTHYTYIKDFELINILSEFSYCRGNVIKYVFRAGKKRDSEELKDLKKARWYLEREISRLESE